MDKTPSPLLPSIGTYWHGPALGPLERACLISMMEQGHSVTLFCHEEIDRVPEGVDIRDARLVTGSREVLTYHRGPRNQPINPSPALFANLFRYHMINQLGMIWSDMDCFLLKPLNLTNGYLFAWQDRAFINNAILALPQSSPTLKNLISFCENEYPVPPFFSLRWKAKLHFMRAVGRPIHVSHQKWGVWGPRALTHFLHKNGEAKYALDSKLFYPIRSVDIHNPGVGTNPLLLTNDEAYERYFQDAVSVHLFGSELRKIMQEMGLSGIPKDSFLQELINIGE